MNLLSINIKRAAALVAIVVVACVTLSEAKLLRRSRFYDEPAGGYDGPYMGGATGERAIITVRGARNPDDGSAPSKIAIEDNPYRGPYPRGVYDRVDGYGRAGRGYPMYPQQDYGYSNYGGFGNIFKTKRRDFMDPDFGVKASLRLENNHRNKCTFNTDADSEIPELGLDSARLNIDCAINPARVADAAVRMAQNYDKYRRERKNRKLQPKGSASKGKRTRINIDTEYVEFKENGDKHGFRPSSSDDED